MKNNKQWEIEFSNKFEDNRCIVKKYTQYKHASCDDIKSFIQQTLDTQRSEIISQIKGIGCEEGVDLVTIAKVINRLNGQE
jgi:hypothetical protein